MDYNALTEQLHNLQICANDLADACDDAWDALYVMEVSENFNQKDYDKQDALCQTLDKEWDKLDEAVELTRNLLNALTEYNDFAEKNAELGLL